MHGYMHAKSLLLCLTSYTHMDCSLQAYLSLVFSKQEYWTVFL